jgi:NitT/TauT family transport system substrate-binding protein
MNRFVIAVIALASALALASCGASSNTKLSTVRVGFFPNLTHAQALVGLADGSFQKAVGSDISIDPIQFNAGPSAIEALFANAIDMTYIGPNPAINGYVQSKGAALRIIAGATSAGAVFVVRPQANIKTAKDLDGKKIASPQLGNTQDVSLRRYIKQAGLATKETGGTVSVIPTANADILTLFQKGDIDGAWVPEPWGARLVREAGGVILVDERDLWPGGKFVTAHLIVSTKFLNEHPDVVKNWLQAHVEVTQWINAHPTEAKTLVNSEIGRLTGKALAPAVLDDAYGRMEVTYDPIRSSLNTSAQWAFEAGFFDSRPDLKNIYDLKLLNEVLSKKGLAAIR